MGMTIDRPDQETSSVYFNSIVRTDVEPMTVESLPKDTLDEFNRQVVLAFTEEAEETTRRVRYLVPYILQAIDWDEYGLPLEAWQLKYYYRRDRFLAKTRLDYDRFLDHDPLQRAVTALGLDPEPTFEFILFLKYYYDLRSELRHSPMEQFERICDALSAMSEGDTASMDVSVNGRHFKIDNPSFVRQALASVDRSQLRKGAFVNDFNEGANRDKIRALDYYIVKTLLDYLPTRKRSARGGMYTQEERNFGLSVLNYLGRLPDDDREGVCSKENNATFDKLMRDFRNVRIPFAMELFL